jgi:hypothetical protein
MSSARGGRSLRATLTTESVVLDLDLILLLVKANALGDSEASQTGIDSGILGEPSHPHSKASYILATYSERYKTWWSTFESRIEPYNYRCRGFHTLVISCMSVTR